MDENKEYFSFISYKREDKKEAKRLQHALEYYHLPNHLWQENPDLPEYVRPVITSKDVYLHSKNNCEKMVVEQSIGFCRFGDRMVKNEP